MLGISIDRKLPQLGTTILFRPGWNCFFTNGKGLGISITLQSPIEFHLSLPLGKKKGYRYY